MDLFITGDLGSFTVVSASLVRCYDCVGESPARGGNSRTGLHHAFKFIQLRYYGMLNRFKSISFLKNNWLI